MIPDFFFVRLFLTLLVYTSVYNLKTTSLLFLVILLIIVDSFDCNYLRIKNKALSFKIGVIYHKYDKINDSLSYLMLLPLLYKVLPFDIFKLLCITTLYRLVGVIHYFNNVDNSIFITIPDLFKEILLVEYASQKYNFISNNKSNVLVLTTFVKSLYEYYHHKIHNNY